MKHKKGIRIEIGRAVGESYNFGNDAPLVLKHPKGDIGDECFIENSGRVKTGERMEYWAEKYAINLKNIPWYLIPEEIEIEPFWTTPIE